MSNTGRRQVSATRKSKGGYSTTIQPKLHESRNSHEAQQAEQLELIGRESDAANIVNLPPVDKGFGAWSYVVSAFAMFIVVWGMYISSYLTLSDTRSGTLLTVFFFPRLPRDLAYLSKLSLLRRKCIASKFCRHTPPRARSSRHCRRHPLPIPPAVIEIQALVGHVRNSNHSPINSAHQSSNYAMGDCSVSRPTLLYWRHHAEFCTCLYLCRVV